MDTTLTGHICCATVHADMWYPRPCATVAKVERDGKFYCGIHDPVVIAGRQAQRVARLDAKIAARKAWLASHV